MKPFGFLTSGSGRLLEQIATYSPEVRAALAVVTTDRECGAEEVARRLGVPVVRLQATSNPAMSDEILEVGIHHDLAFFLVLFNRLLSGQLLVVYENRIANLHPTLLPAFPGLRGLRDCLASDARFLGSTIHFVDTSVDGGPIIVQAVLPRNTTKPMADLRRAHFGQMCQASLQVVEWLAADRVTVSDRRALVVDASYSDPDFSPNLDSATARAFKLLALADPPVR